jgi:hypothetical protein
MDVFAFGVLLFEIFAREAPWKDVTNLVAATMVLSGERTQVPASANRVRNLIARCWAIDTKDRPEMIVVQREISELLNED